VAGYYYDGSASGSRTFQNGRSISAGIQSRVSLLFLQPTFSPDLNVLGGQPSFTLGFGGANQLVTAEVSTINLGTVLHRSDEVWGVTDLYPTVSLAWTLGSSNGPNHVMTYLTGDAPVGDYDPNRLANIGLGHGAIDAGGGYTFLDEKSGFEASAVLGFTYNLENTTVDYKNGVDSHLDYAISQFLSDQFHVGAVGYVYYQLTDDSGSGNHVGGFRSKVAAIGGEVGYFFKVNGLNWYINFRGYSEFWAQNRVQGYDLWLTLNIPLGGVKSKAKEGDKGQPKDSDHP
jgi:hypothetical protein